MKGYAPLAFLWKILGYDVRIFSFRWEVPTEDFSASLGRLLKYIDNLDSPVNIIGASAGGSAAVRALQARPQAVKKVATVAAVFRYEHHLHNLKLKDSVEGIEEDAAAKFHHQILSIYGLYDQKVPISSTMQLNVPGYRVLMIGHGATIAAALTLYAHSIDRFLRP